VVRAADGILPAAGARVRLERATPMAGAGSFTYTPPGGTAVTRMMPGSSSADAAAQLQWIRAGYNALGYYRSKTIKPVFDEWLIPLVSRS
jgi:hypothetical protein